MTNGGEKGNPMHEITVHPPVVSGQQVRFGWRVEPATELYRAEQFTVRFPESIDLTRVPAGLWWRVALICLHGHWPLLRPCRVRLPVRLGLQLHKFIWGPDVKGV